MCDKVFKKCFLVFIYISDQYKTQEKCDSFISEDPFVIRYALDQYKTQQMCDEAVGFLIRLLQVNWLRNFLHTVLYADDDKSHFNEDSGDVIFSCNEMNILNVDLRNINLDDTNYDKDDLETIIQVRILAWHSKLEKHKALKKELKEEFMLIAWYTRRWWDFCLLELEKKEIEPIFTDWCF